MKREEEAKETHNLSSCQNKNVQLFQEDISSEEDFPRLTERHNNDQIQSKKIQNRKITVMKQAKSKNRKEPATSKLDHTSQTSCQSESEIENSKTKSPLYSQTLNPRSCTYTEMQNSTPHYHKNDSARKSPISQENLQRLATKLIPILIKLFLNTNITNRIECFLELGSLLKSEKIVSETLEDLGLSSIINS